MRLIYATRLSFLDHWGCDLSVSHLASVATRESLSFSTAISFNWMKIWCGKRYFTALDMRPCQWITVDGQFEPRFVCQWEFFLGYPMFGPIVEETKKSKFFLFPEGFRLPSCYRSASAVFGPLIWSLNVLVAMNCRGHAMMIDWCSRISMPWDIPKLDM